MKKIPFINHCVSSCCQLFHNFTINVPKKLSSYFLYNQIYNLFLYYYTLIIARLWKGFLKMGADEIASRESTENTLSPGSSSESGTILLFTTSINYSSSKWVKYRCSMESDYINLLETRTCFQGVLILCFIWNMPRKNHCVERHVQKLHA
jgi:hypothetical protein